MDANRIAAALLALPLAGCLLTPEGLDDERDRADTAGAAFARAPEERRLPELPARPGIDDLLQRALLANGDVEAAWHAWRAALAGVEVESAWPEGQLEVDVAQAFSGGSSGWDSTAVTLLFEPMLMWPSKAEARGRIALAEARAAGERFRTAVLELRARVVESASRVALLDAIGRLQAETTALLTVQINCCGRALVEPGGQREYQRLQLEARLAADEEARTAAELARERAALDGLLARAGGEPLSIALEGLGERPIPGTDAELLQRAAAHNPELAALAREVEGRAEALELARLAYLPDLSPMAGFVGSAEQMLGLMVGLPTNLPAIRAGIERATAALEATRARSGQAGRDVAARVVGELVALRDAERQAQLFADDLLPLAARLSESARIGYVAGSVTQRDWLDVRRIELDARRTLLAARAQRETALARLEALVGVLSEGRAVAAEVRS